MTSEEVDSKTQAMLRGVLETVVHDNTAEESNASDADGFQGGQVWAATATEAPMPEEQEAPTPEEPAPIIPGYNNVRGEFFYDRNSNGVKDSNVEATGLICGSSDIEFECGVGGITVEFYECDGETGEQGDGAGSTVTVGAGALGEPQLVPSIDMNGKFNLVLLGTQLTNHYLVRAKAPPGFLLTAGVCNNNEPGWECNPSGSVRDRRALEEVAIGIEEGRSTTCVYVDPQGNVEEPLSFGVMRAGDIQNVESNLALVLEFDDPTTDRYNRHLTEVIRRASILDEADDGTHVTTRYLLAEEDRMAIGTVTAEVTAAALSFRLAEDGVSLDSVKAKEVIMSNTRLKDDAVTAAVQAQLAVGMQIRGHYSPPPDLDFDYIVQDSINRDTSSIRRGLREYNHNCREQTTKINKGLQESDFEAVVSSSGTARPGRGGGRPVTIGAGVQPQGNVYSTACSSQLLVPEYFETSLKDIETLDVSEVKNFFGDVTYLASDGGLDSWAVGPVAAIAGLIILLIGAFLFRRALGPRLVYSNVLTQDVSKDEKRRFGEVDDDEFVDPEFYSDSDDDLDETEKERKMRRKVKEKEGSTKSQKARRKNKDIL